MKNKKGLAIIEVIMIILLITIMAFVVLYFVRKFQNINETNEFENFQHEIMIAADQYIEKYRDVLPASELCINIPYQNLKKEDLINESDFECNADGIISIYQDQKENRYQLYLTCKNSHTDEEIYHQEGNPNECIQANGNFAIQIQSLKEVKNGTLQDYVSTNWSSGDIRIELSSYNPYFYPIQEYQYSLDNGITYKTIDGTELVLNENYNGKIKIRAMDTNHDYSTEKTLYIKLDKTIPNVIIQGMSTLNTNIESNTYAYGNIILTGQLQNNPISFVSFDWYSCANTTDIQSCSKILENSRNYQATTNGIYRIKAITEAGLYQFSNPFEVKIDKTIYKIKIDSNNQNITLINNTTGIRSTSEISARVGDQITITNSSNTGFISAIYDKPTNLIYGTKIYQFGNQNNTFIMDRSDMTITVS